MTTRRQLIKTSLSLAAVPIGMSVAIEVAHAEDMPQWDKETDVLVLGYGNAGSNAAIAAADAGAKVLILEKTAAGGGNVSVSSGGFVVPTNKEDYYNEVLGVEAIYKGKPYFVKANKAVVICTGGFQSNPELMARYIYGNPMAYLGSPAHTGDGLLMAQSMGCDLWHMNSVSAPLGIQVPGVKAGIAMVTRQPAFIWVDQDGKRFVNEKKLDYHCSWMAVNNFDAINHRYPRIPCYMIMDSSYLKAGPLISNGGSGWDINREGYKWSKDNQKEIDSGVIIKADTVEELAKKLGIADPAVLAATVKRWNSDLREKGIDTEYGRTLTADPNMKAVFVGRDVKSWSAPIEEGPFYAVKLVPVTYHTMGGPKKSVKAEVLDPFGEPIPRLYVAGELGSTWGLTYQGACANADAMVFGRVAGKNAAALEN